MTENTRWAIKLNRVMFSELEKVDITLERREHNLDGVQFERAMIRRFPKLRAIPQPVPLQLQSYFSRGRSGHIEPIVDGYFNNRGSKFLVEIKKGFHYRAGMPCIATSREQLQVLTSGTTRDGGNGVKYDPGEYWIFQPHRMSSSRTRTVKYTLYRALPGLVRFMNRNQGTLGVNVTSGRL